MTLLTSGTTGRPKAANHTWTTLVSPVRRGSAIRTKPLDVRLSAQFVCRYAGDAASALELVDLGDAVLT